MDSEDCIDRGYVGVSVSDPHGVSEFSAALRAARHFIDNHTGFYQDLTEKRWSKRNGILRQAQMSLREVQVTATRILAFIDEAVYSNCERELQKLNHRHREEKEDRAKAAVKDVPELAFNDVIHDVAAVENTADDDECLVKSFNEERQKLLHIIAKEQEKTECQICFTATRNTLVLPCMHFLYCNHCIEKHQLQSNLCPTCRSHIRGILHCNRSNSVV